MSFRKRLDNWLSSNLENLALVFVTLCGLGAGIATAVVSGQFSIMLGIIGFIIGTSFGGSLGKIAVLPLFPLLCGVAHGIALVLDKCLGNSDISELDPEFAPVLVTNFESQSQYGAINSAATDEDHVAAALEISTPSVMTGQYGVSPTPVNTSVDTTVKSSPLLTDSVFVNPDSRINYQL